MLFFSPLLFHDFESFVIAFSEIERVNSGKGSSSTPVHLSEKCFVPVKDFPGVRAQYFSLHVHCIVQWHLSIVGLHPGNIKIVLAMGVFYSSCVASLVKYFDWAGVFVPGV